MGTYLKSYKRFFPNLIYVLVMMACFLVCAMMYEPRPMQEILHSGETALGKENLFYFNVSILEAIILVVLTLTRLVFYLMRNRLDMNLLNYSVWCVLEIVAISVFGALYLALMDKGGYFPFLAKTLYAMLAVLLIPAAIMTLVSVFKEAATAEPADEGARLKFYDSRHQLKFITSAASILYIEANENYIIIHYQENGIEKQFQIRNSMKNIEPLCERAGFVRTHRSYIVNPVHIRMVRKDVHGLYFADLGTEKKDGIPVSKKYYDNVTAAL
jgi:hypothetical protein